MGAIPDINEPWAGHSGLEVETFIKQQIAGALSLAGGKYGYVEMVGSDLRFYDEEGGTVLASISLGGDVYTIDIHSNLDRLFYVLADETTKILTISADTTVSPFGSSQGTPYPEGYTYTIAVNTGGGYVPRATGTIPVGESASVDIRPFLATGDNYVRISMVGLSSGQTKTIVLTGTLTSLTMSVDHAWENVWMQGADYVITGIRFAGSIAKVLHVSLDGVELPSESFSPNQSYTTSATTYTIPASVFPAGNGNGIHTVSVWMTAGSVSTPVTVYHIMCAEIGDTTPMVAINDITPMAVNYESSRLFGYAVYAADKVSIALAATLGGVSYPIAPVEEADREEGQRYDFAYNLEINTGGNTAVLGTLSASATAYEGGTQGRTDSRSTSFDNTYSYIATPGALFYLNAANRSNGAADYDKIINEMGASRDGNFAAQYDAVWTGLSWNSDGWATDPGGNKALVIPAGGSAVITDLAPLSLMAAYPNGFTIEMMIQCGSPSEYDTPVFQMYSGNNGILIYPTKILALGTSERSETLQSVNIAENRMTHIVITFTKNYEGVPSRNLVSIFINGISNVNFAFDGSSSFGSGPLTIGQANTDAYLYKMRIYGNALDSRSVFNNFLNCIVDGLEFDRRQQYNANNILDGGVVDYEACKSAGFNTMIVIMDDDSHDIPSFDNQASFDGCTLRFEYADAPLNNVTVQNVSLDGQGTTSKKYFRWNLRAKTGSGTVWTYGDGTSETGKEGFFAGTGRVRVDRITAKKNYASSMQGHKMGMTGLYNDLFKQIGLGSGLPDPNYMVAVYQYPFVGFKYNATNDTYEFIGLYTAGPDKGSKVTFGYASSYGSLLSLEGPNHAPRGTRFLHPWVDVAYDYQDETLKFGGEEGWDCDYVGGGLSTDKASSAAAILALYESEWRPAYEIVFNCSPYIASYREVLAGLPGLSTLSDLLSAANVQTIFAGSTNGISNQLISFYDDEYELYFYRTSTEKFEKLQTVDASREHNVVSYLYSNGYLSTQSPTTAQIVSARSARFKAEFGRTWDVNQTLFHYCYCVLFGATDNFAKNSYPFKFLPLSDTGAGNRWGWREDDLDTVLATDNNGTNTKSYSVEHGDTSGDGVEIFQGGNSALWVIIRDNYASEIKQMMNAVATAAAAIATTLGIQGDGLHNSLFNLVSRYCWEHSAKYFAATLYENDRRWSYLEPWLIDPSAVYNNVPPLTQALGDQYQGEMLWTERRIAYIFSKYRIGAFTGDNMGYGAIAFTLAQPYTFYIVPAIDLYPVISLANTSDTQGGRTRAGQAAQMTITADGQTTNYIHGGDWLASLGDLAGMLLTSRGAGSDIAFSINNARIQTLKIGDATPGNVVFNATNLQVSSPALTLIDARNTATIRNAVDLLNCPRLRKALFGGSGATGLLLPVGAKLDEVSFPSAANTVFMHSLPYLEQAHLSLPAYAGIVSLYINNCPNINPITLVKEILNTQGSLLDYVTIIWKGVLTVTQADINALYALTELSGYVDYRNGSVIIVSGEPDVEGAITSDAIISASAYYGIKNTFPKVIMSFDKTKVYVDFVDPYVEAIALANWDRDQSGAITLDEAEAVTGIGSLFRNNTNIEHFDEFEFFIGVTATEGNWAGGAFSGCTNLKSVTLPDSLVTLGESAFSGCAALEAVKNTKNVQTISGSAFKASVIKEADFPALRSIGSSAFLNCQSLQEVKSLGQITTIPDGDSSGNGVFRGCSSLAKITFPNTLETIGSYTFVGCNALDNVVFPESLITIKNDSFKNIPGSFSGFESVQTIGTQAFEGCFKGTETIHLRDIVTINGGAFRNAKPKKIIIGPNIQTIGYNSQWNIGGAFESGSDDTALDEVVFEGNVYSIDSYAFSRRKALTKINLPASLVSLGSYVFRGTSIDNDEVYLPNLLSIGQYTFAETKIKMVTSLGTITSVPNNLFASCDQLLSINFPATVTSIAGSITSNATSLQKITMNSAVPPSITDSSFNYGLSSFKEVLVPGASIAAYMTATNWTVYRLKSRMLPKETGNDAHAVINGFTLRFYDSGYKIDAWEGLGITFFIPVTNLHQLRISGGAVSSSDYSMQAHFYGTTNNAVASVTLDANPKTYLLNNANVVSMRLTVKMSELANAYVYDETTQEYLWKGSEVTTIYNNS